MTTASRDRVRLAILSLPTVALAIGFIVNLLYFSPYPSVMDGVNYFSWQQSLLIDGDLDTGNQIEPWQPGKEKPVFVPSLGRKVVVNKYPIGWSLTLLPAMLPAHAIERATGWGKGAAVPKSWGTGPTAPPGGELPYAYATLLFVSALGVATVWLTHAWLVRFVDRDAAAVAATLAFFGSSAFAYFWRGPYYAHGVAAFWLSLALYATTRYAERANASRRWLILAGAAAGMLYLTRALDTMLLLPAAVILAWALVRGERSRRAIAFDAALASLPAIALVALQCCVLKRVYGEWFFNGYAAKGEHFTGSLAVLPKVLFSENHGLFLWHPLLFVAVVGFAMGFARRPGELRWLAAAALASAAAVAVTYAFWWCWWLGSSWGARWSGDLMPLWALGLAMSMTAATRPPRPFLAGLGFAPLALATVASLILQVLGLLPVGY